MHSTKIEKVQILLPTCHRARGKRKAWRQGRTRGEIIALGSADEGQSKTRMSDGGKESAWNAHPRSRRGWAGLGWRSHAPPSEGGNGSDGVSGLSGGGMSEPSDRISGSAWASRGRPPPPRRPRVSNPLFQIRFLPPSAARKPVLLQPQ